MSKTIPANLLLNYESERPTVAHAMKITRRDSTVYGFTSGTRDAVISAVTYKANPGLDVSGIVIAANAAVGNLELRTIHDGSTFATGDILSGLWRNAAFQIFRYNWANLSDGIDILLVGTLGDVTIQQTMIVAELRDIRQYLQQPVGALSQKTCRYRLGDAKCRKNISGSPWTVTGTLTDALNNQVVEDTNRAEGIDYFGEGTFTFTSGANAGVEFKIKTFGNGVFEFALPTFYPIAGDETYTAVVGCRKRLEVDCEYKFDNVLNFGGEPHRKGINSLTQAP